MDEQSQKRKLRDLEQSSSSNAILCVNNCGFFGNPGTNNLCSRCYYEHQLKQPNDVMDSAAVSGGAGGGSVADVSSCADGSSCAKEAPTEAVANRAEATAGSENQEARSADHSGQPSSSNPVFCANNCGFFGNPTTNNLCSKCYSEHPSKKSKEASSCVAAAEDTNEDGVVHGSSCAEEAPVETMANRVQEVAASENQDKRPVNRCGFCRKRVGLTGFKCKCGETYCSVHRYSDKHDCVFNYKSAGRDAIAKANPVVKADKIDKI